jgi:integrase
LTGSPHAKLTNTIQVSNIATMETNPVQSWLNRLAPNSRATAEGSLRRCASILFGDRPHDWHLISVSDMSLLASELAKTKMPSTVSKEMSFVREVLRECWRLGIKTREDLERAVSVRWTRPPAPPVGKHLEKHERSTVLDTCGSDMVGLRDRVALRLLMLGLRRAEAVNARVENFSPDMTSLLVDGKGRRRREVFIGPKACEDIRRYLEARGREDGYILLSSAAGKFGKVDCPLTVRALNKIVTKVCARSGVKFTPHDMRRSAIGDWLDTVGIEIAMKMAGHSNPQTTARYDHRKIGEAARRAAASSEV